MLAVSLLNTLSFPTLSLLCLFHSSLLQLYIMDICHHYCEIRFSFQFLRATKTAAVSSNYFSTLSKVLEWMILHKYSEFFTSSHLQFGFKPHSSTSLCTGVVKNAVPCYIRSGSSVYGCFLDASKAFDLMDHSFLFHKLLESGLPLLVVRFCFVGIPLRNVVYIGVLVSLIRLGFPMVFVRVVFSLLFFLLCIWMVYYLSWLSVVLVVIGKIWLLGVYVSYADNIVLLALLSAGATPYNAIH